jgi:hypothetical protein
MFDQAIEHPRSLYLCLKERDDGPHLFPEYLPDLPPMFVLHLNAIEDELRGIFINLILIYQFFYIATFDFPA